MLDAVTYDKVKLLHELSCMAWFIDKHACDDCDKAENKAAHELFVNLKNDLEKYIDLLHKSLCK